MSPATKSEQAFTDEAHVQGLEYFKTWYASDGTAPIKTVDEVISDWRRAATQHKQAELVV